tara:strand:- start:2629 stop:2916 length:288 start_codon:yes stop_codon:yes gene_type:complete
MRRQRNVCKLRKASSLKKHLPNCQNENTGKRDRQTGCRAIELYVEAKLHSLLTVARNFANAIVSSRNGECFNANTITISRVAKLFSKKPVKKRKS